MASLNPLTRELVFKVVFYGPGLGGKTTTLQHIHAATKPEHRGKMVSLATPMDRTLYFDFLPIRVPRVRGMSVRLQLFTVPGQVYYGATRKLVLTGADGVVFVADSQEGRQDANVESLEDLVTNLADHNRRLVEVPHTFHWNKRDLSDLVPMQDLDKKYNPHGVPSLGTVATMGDGVFEGLERITRLVVRAYEAEIPRGERSFETRDSSGEVSIAEAIRGLTESPERPSVTPFGGMPAVTLKPPTAPLSSLPFSHEVVAAMRGPTPPTPAPPPEPTEPAAPANATPENPPTPPPATPEKQEPAQAPAHEEAALDERAGADESEALKAARIPVGKTMPVEAPLAFTMVDVWPESDREAARDAESSFSTRDFGRGVLTCELLLSRVLTPTITLIGSEGSPGDLGLGVLLLGLDGRRYLAFRAVVQAARQNENVTLRQALDCYAFVLEARRSQDV